MVSTCKVDIVMISWDLANADSLQGAIYMNILL